MYTPTALTKEMIINAFKEKSPSSYAEDNSFQFIIRLIDIFPNIKISSEFPVDLLTDIFDLMLEIFADWEYNKMTNSDIEKLADFIVINTNIYRKCMDALFYAISTYATIEVLNKLINAISITIDKSANNYKQKIINELKKDA